MKKNHDFNSSSTSVVISAAASTTLALEDKVSAGTRKPGRRAWRGQDPCDTGRVGIVPLAQISVSL